MGGGTHYEDCSRCGKDRDFGCRCSKQSTDPALSAMNCGCDPGCGWVREDCHVHQVVDGRLVTKEAGLLSKQEERDSREWAEQLNNRMEEMLAPSEQTQAEVAAALRSMSTPVLVLVHQRASVERSLRSAKEPPSSVEKRAQEQRIEEAKKRYQAMADEMAKVPTVPGRELPTHHLPADPKERKGAPIYSGVVRYFPDALVAVAQLSKVGNDQHNPGQPLHWAREKSTDHHDCILRHITDAGTLDSDGVRHSTKVAWRALAALQVEIEADREKQPGEPIYFLKDEGFRPLEHGARACCTQFEDCTRACTPRGEYIERKRVMEQTKAINCGPKQCLEGLSPDARYNS